MFCCLVGMFLLFQQLDQHVYIKSTQHLVCRSSGQGDTIFIESSGDDFVYTLNDETDKSYFDGGGILGVLDVQL